MINRRLSTSTAVLLAFAVTVPSLSFAQTPTAPAAAPPPSTPPGAAPAPSGPAPSAAPAPAPSADTTERPATYTIVQGDTLWSIAHKYDTSIHALMKLNGLKKHALLHIGQVIKLPPANSDSTSK